MMGVMGIMVFAFPKLAGLFSVRESCLLCPFLDTMQEEQKRQAATATVTQAKKTK